MIVSKGGPMDVRRMAEMAEIKKRLERLTKELGKYSKPEDTDNPKQHTAEEIERTDAVREEIARLNAELEELGRT
jgi:hypothetical protein